MYSFIIPESAALEAMSMARVRSRFDFDKLLTGAAAGLIGTAPMTAFMVVGWQLLPAQEKYPLPPRQIMEELTERAGIDDDLSEGQHVAATLLSHFGYGALAGSVYALVQEEILWPPSLKGAVAGVVVWAGSYLGWIPAIGILPPATRHPWRRNLLMIIAHIIWGATMSVMTHKLDASRILKS